MIIRLRVIIPQASHTFCLIFHDMIHETTVASRESSMREIQFLILFFHNAKSSHDVVHIIALDTLQMEIGRFRETDAAQVRK